MVMSSSGIVAAPSANLQVVTSASHCNSSATYVIALQFESLGESVFYIGCPCDLLSSRAMQLDSS